MEDQEQDVQHARRLTDAQLDALIKERYVNEGKQRMPPLKQDIGAGEEEGSRTARSQMSHAPLVSTQEPGQRHHRETPIPAAYDQSPLLVDPRPRGPAL